MLIVVLLYTYLFAFFSLHLVNIRCYASKMILCCFEYTQHDVCSHTYLLMPFNPIRVNVPKSCTVLYFDLDSFDEHINAFWEYKQCFYSHTANVAVFFLRLLFPCSSTDFPIHIAAHGERVKPAVRCLCHLALSLCGHSNRMYCWSTMSAWKHTLTHIQRTSM